MGKALALMYGVVCHLMFLAIFVYFIAWVGDFTSLVPKTIDSGAPGPVGAALAINIGLLLLFAVPHSVMARPGFKQAWTKIVPKTVERSTYVLQSNLLLILLIWQWRPMTSVIWNVEGPLLSNALTGLMLLGFVIVVISSFIIDHFDLFGTRQVVLYSQGKEYTHSPFKVIGFYKFVRHPLLLGWMIAFWATPVMTTGHLLFAIVTTAYMLVAIQLEEKDLGALHGAPYRQYRQKVSMILPTP